MATEEGVVIKIDSSGTALVKTIRSSACESCSSQGTCHAMGGEEMEVEVINTVDANVDDTVVISFRTSSLLKASFLIHIFPIICMIIGALIGQEIAPRFNYNPSTSSAFFGFLFLIISFLFIKSKGNKMAESKEYKPEIIRVIRAG
ncbi:MAG: SoxR reducing system RseC family protein [Desulfobacterales bacterium]|nr:SoxR reducing system RseC family protein [Desulfobacteraceae bacterium]MBT4363965.1 SoxR reducing system RseC family protein [Desulfobacteraceae bacterium]MBT7085164.1 SoxR reducing system RseC family protein [Desulfobacterales bacterium]MBT7696396.1 SoxR reducing system RseC family protein [Desulfobacterales bacterium]